LSHDELELFVEFGMRGAHNALKTLLLVKMQAIFSRESFIKTSAQPQDVIEGWRPKVEG